MYKIPHIPAVVDRSFLVTGGAGFIGSHIVKYLLKNGAKEVRALDNLSTGHLSNIEDFIDDVRFKFINGDTSDYKICIESCKDIDGVFHQAALGSVPRSIKDPLSTNNSNVNGFANIITASKNQGVKKFVYASSSSVYGDNTSYKKIEQEVGNVLSPYALSKKVNELYADIYHRTYGLPTIGLRYFNVFGPNQDPNGEYAAVIPIFISRLLNNKPISIFGDGTTSRDFTYVDNVVYANILSYSSSISYGLYNIACGESTSLNELFNIIKDKTGSNNLPNYELERKGDIKNSLADITKSQKEIGYSPIVNLSSGLDESINWYKL